MPFYLCIVWFCQLPYGISYESCYTSHQCGFAGPFHLNGNLACFADYSSSAFSYCV